MRKKFLIAIFSLIVFLLFFFITTKNHITKWDSLFSLNKEKTQINYKEILIKALENKTFFNADYDYFFSKDYIERIKNETEKFNENEIIIGDWIFQPDSGYFKVPFLKGIKKGYISGYVNKKMILVAILYWW